MTKTAIIYARVSTAGQAEDDVSVPSQLERARAWCAERGAEVLAEYADEGRSGWWGARKAFVAALEHCRASDVTYFVTWSSARFGRNRDEAYEGKRGLDAAGTTLIYVSQPIDRTTDVGWMADAMHEIFDEMRSRELSRDTTRSMISNAEKGYFCGGVPPLGYRSAPAPDNPKRRRLEVVEDEAPLVREIFQLRVQGLGIIAIARRLNNSGRLRRGKRWTKHSLLALLRNRAVIGQAVFNRKDRRTGRDRPPEDWRIVDSHPPIIDKNTWDQVQKTLNHPEKERRGSEKSQFLFTGILRCGACGGSMQIETATGRNKVYRYYNCRTWLISRECRRRRIPAHELDALLVEAIGERIFTAGNIKRLFEDLMLRRERFHEERDEQLRGVKSELQQLSAERDRYLDAIGQQGTQTPGLESVMERIGELEKAIKALRHEVVRLEELEPPPAPKGKVDTRRVRQALIKMLQTTEKPRQTREFFNDFIQEVRVEPDAFEIRYDPARMVSGPAPAVHSNCIWLPGRDQLRTRRVTVPMPAEWAVAA